MKGLAPDGARFAQAHDGIDRAIAALQRARSRLAMHAQQDDTDAALDSVEAALSVANTWVGSALRALQIARGSERHCTCGYLLGHQGPCQGAF